MDDPELLDHVLALPPSQRAAAIERACDDDPARQRLLLALVDVADRAPSRPDGPSTESSATAVRSPVQSEALAEGEHIGRYVVAGLVGEGGFGQVYEAFDLELRRRVALKLLRVDRNAKPDDRRRFVREAQALAKIDHPNVVRVYDAGEHEGRRYLTMELIEGRSLGAALARAAGDGPPAWREVLPRIIAAARGLAAAHEAGVVHRDIKPSNIMVDDQGRVVVTDFGVARTYEVPTVSGEDRERGSTPALADIDERTASALGTPYYMAPEQFEGEATPRSDQYSLCLVLVDALSPGGKRPALARLQTASSGEPVATSLAAVAAPGWLRKVLARGLSVDPSRRYPDLAAFIDAVNAPQRRRRWGALGLGAVLLAVPVGWGAWAREASPCDQWAVADVMDEVDPVLDTLADAVPASGSPEVAAATVAGLRAQSEWQLRQWARARTESCNQGVNGIIDGPTTRARDTCFARWREQLERRLEWAAAEPARLLRPALTLAMPRNPTRCRYVDPPASGQSELSPAVRTSIEHALEQAVARRIEGDFEGAATVSQQVLERVASLDDGPYRAQVTAQLGVLAARVGRTDEALTLLQRALGEAERRRLDGLAAEIQTSLAETLALRPGADPTAAAPWVALAQAKMERGGGRHDENEPALRLVEGHLAFVEGRYGESEAAYAAAVEQLDALGGPADFRAAAARSAMALAIVEQGRREEGLSQAEDALTRHAQRVGAAHPLVVAARSRLATAYLRAAAVAPEHAAAWRAAALEHLTQVVEDGRDSHGPDSVLVAKAAAERVELLLAENKIDDEVAQQLADCVDVFDGPPQPRLSVADRTRGLRIAMHGYHALGDWSAARDVAERLVRAHARRGSATDVGPRDDALMLIVYRSQTGDVEQAQRELAEHRSDYLRDYRTDPSYAARVDALYAQLRAMAPTSPTPTKEPTP